MPQLLVIYFKTRISIMWTGSYDWHFLWKYPSWLSLSWVFWHIILPLPAMRTSVLCLCAKYVYMAISIQQFVSVYNWSSFANSIQIIGPTTTTSVNTQGMVNIELNLVRGHTSVPKILFFVHSASTIDM